MQGKKRSVKSRLPERLDAAGRSDGTSVASPADATTTTATTEPTEPVPFRHGILAGVLTGRLPDFEPMSDEELDELEREKDERIRAV